MLASPLSSADHMFVTSGERQNFFPLSHTSYINGGFCRYTYEKEIVMYAYFKRLDYFSTECTYSPFAARGFAREYVKDLEVQYLVL